MRRLRSEMQIIFQDPYSSLNPRMTVGDIVGEPLADPRARARARRARDRVAELLRTVGLAPDACAPLSARVLRRPAPAHRHRARAGRTSPSSSSRDEPVSALDVSIRRRSSTCSRICRRELGLTYLFIAHDLARDPPHQSDRVAVMYLGRIVELADAETLFDAPAHPYTRMLLVGDSGAGAGRARHARSAARRPAESGRATARLPLHTRCAGRSPRARRPAPSWPRSGPGTSLPATACGTCPRRSQPR